MTLDFKSVYYAGLHDHTEKSLIDGVGSVKDHMRVAKKIGHCGCCVTDHGSFANALELIEEGRKQEFPVAAGIEFYACESVNDDNYFHITAFAKNEIGYKNICILRAMSSKPDHFYKRPRITYKELLKHKEGIIITSGCISSIINKSILKGDLRKAEKYIRLGKLTFKDDFYIEIHIGEVSTEWVKKADDTYGYVSLKENLHEKINKYLIEWSKKYQIPAYFVQDAHLPEKRHYEAQKIMMLNDPRNKSQWHFDKALFKMSVEEMHGEVKRLYPFISDDDFVDYCINTRLVYDKINYDNLKFKPQLITFKPEEHRFWNYELKPIDNPDWQVLVEKSKSDKILLLVLKIIQSNGRLKNKDNYYKRIKDEILLVQYNGYIELLNYFLVIEDVAHFVVESDSIISTSRGSGGSFLLAFLIGISSLDPMLYEGIILPNRFLTLSRIASGSLPDFDFDTHIQKPIYQHLVIKYGVDHVARIATYQYLQIKGTLKDVLRVKRPDLTFDDVNKLTKAIDSVLIPEEIMELGGRREFLYLLDNCPELQTVFKNDNELKDLCLTLFGTAKSTGIHAGGVVLCDKPIFHITPTKWSEKEGMWLTEAEMAWVEKAGLVKYDFLNLSTLKDINDAFKLIKKRHGKRLSITNIPYDDQNVFKEFEKANAVGIFQFGTPLALGLLRRLNSVKSIVDLAIITSTARPGPLKAKTDYELVARVKDPRKIKYKHEKLIPILKDSYGLIIFQENIMRIAEEIAGFDQGKSADLIKALSKKVKEKVLKFGDDFINGCVEFGKIEKNIAEDIWSEIVGFAEYAFNSGHAIGYALLSYVCMYLKHYYPMEFKISVMSNADKESLYEYLLAWGEDIIKPDVNRSSDVYQIIKENGVEKILMPLSGINGVASKATDYLLNVRPFNSMEDFLERGRSREANIGVICNLIWSGACDSFLTNILERKELVKKLLAEALSKKEKELLVNADEYIKNFNIKKIVGDDKEKDKQLKLYNKIKKIHEIDKMSKIAIIRTELELLGFTAFDYETVLKEEGIKASKILGGNLLSTKKLNHLMENESVVVMGGFFNPKETFIKKDGPNKGKAMFRFNLITPSGLIPVIIFHNEYKAFKEELKNYKTSSLHKAQDFSPVVIKGTVNVYNGDVGIVLNKMITL